jgi:hypothetical protein
VAAGERRGGRREVLGEEQVGGRGLKFKTVRERREREEAEVRKKREKHGGVSAAEWADGPARLGPCLALCLRGCAACVAF